MQVQRQIIDGKIYYQLGNRRTMHETSLGLGWREIQKNGNWERLDNEPRWFVGVMAWVEEAKK